jgi:hypothetical protein
MGKRFVVPLPFSRGIGACADAADAAEGGEGVV